VWNTLPSYIRDTTKSIESFKTLLRKHYKDLTDSVFNPDDPRTQFVRNGTQIVLYGTYYNAYEYYFILWFNSTYEYSILAVADGVRDREGCH
jgi:hypothetical protein